MENYNRNTSKLQLAVPFIEYPHAVSCCPGKASPEIWRSSIAGSGSSSAADDCNKVRIRGYQQQHN